MDKAGAAGGGWVEEIKAGISADPEPAVAVFEKGKDAGGGEGGRVIGVMKIANEFFGGEVVFVEPVFCTHPEVAVAVDQEGVYPGIAERIGVSFDREINCEAIAVELVEAGLSAEPEKAVAVAGDGQDGILGKALLDGQGAEEKAVGRLGAERDGSKCNGEGEEEVEG